MLFQITLDIDKSLNKLNTETIQFQYLIETNIKNKLCKKYFKNDQRHLPKI